MSRPILGAVDAFDRSPPAAACAGWLATATGAPLELVYVLDPGGLPALSRAATGPDPGLRRAIYERQEEAARMRAGARLARLAAELADEPVRIAVLEGAPATLLQEHAAWTEALLIVTGTAARMGIEHVLAGSVAGEVALGAPCPVVIVPPDATVGDEGPVLVGDDGTDDGRAAARHAAALAARLGRELVALHVEDGDAVQGLCDAAREHRACLLVVGNRGRGPVRAELFGSVSVGLVQTAGRPVAVVPRTAGEPG